MNRLYLILFLAILAMPVEIVCINAWKKQQQKQIRSRYKSKEYMFKQKRNIQHEQQKSELARQHEVNKHLAMGRTVFDRVYNKKEQTIIDLIDGLAGEALPEQWKWKVEIEEFTSFILLVHCTEREEDITAYGTAEILKPIVNYSYPYLENIAVLDKKHKCFLFFDKDSLELVRSSGDVSPGIADDIREKGRNFTRFNSVNIDCEVVEGHLFVPSIVLGDYGIYECMMLLDTGASMTVISLDMAQKTNNENLNSVSRRPFSTAGGTVHWPIVKRTVIVGGIEKYGEVAVNPEDNTNLLGVDFFDGYEYTIDSQSKRIYVWSK